MALLEHGFAAVAEIHALMSFHEPRSDVSRLNRMASQRTVQVAPQTMQVLRLAQRIAQLSDGVFDVSVAPRLVHSGFLPHPPRCPAPDPRANWRDIQLKAGNSVRFLRPLWIDLGGIAKGFAVDAALAAIRRHSRRSVQINAGGDLRVSGPISRTAALDVPGHDRRHRALVQLRNAALASSCGWPQRRGHRGAWQSPHVHGGAKRCGPIKRFVSVVAPRAADADALSKVVMALGPSARAILRRRGASAYLHEPRSGWQRL